MGAGRWKRIATCVVALHGVQAAVACGAEQASTERLDDAGTSAPRALQPAPGVTFEGSATDEALAGLLARPRSEAASRAGVLSSPAASASLRADAPPRFAWDTTIAARGRGKGGSLPEKLLELVERTAWAHGPPMYGAGFYLSFTVEGAEVLRVFTSKGEYTPAAAVWTEATSSGRDVSLQITSGMFDANALMPGGGPFTAPAVTFRVER